MKKITTLFLFSGMISAGMGQSINFQPLNNSIPETLPTRINPHPPASPAAIDQVSAWFNYGREISLAVNSSAYYRNYLFPDSTVRANFTGGVSSVWKHSFGEILDPTSPYFPSYIDPEISYTVDSVGFWYRYYRFQNAADDTVVFQVFQNSKITFNQWNAQSADPDTPYAYVSYSNVLRKGLSPNLEVKVPINFNDTVSGNFVRFLAIPVNITVPAGEKIAATFTYFPGNPFNINDTIDPLIVPPAINQINALTVFDYKDSAKTLEENIYNNEMMVPTTVRYNYNTQNWNGKYIPGTSWNAGYYNMDMEFKITTINLSSQEIRGGLRSAQIFPNPVLKGRDAGLKFFIEKDRKVKCSVYDITGKTILVTDEKSYPQGNNFISLSTSQLKSGVYLCKISGEDFSVVKKLIIF